MSGVPSFSELMTQFFDVPASHLKLSDGHMVVSYASEAELRTGLAQLARAYGWNVQEEVVVPGWGRIDLVLDDGAAGGSVFLIELKVALTKPSDVRRAFQQADGYGRWWAQSRSRNAVPILSAAESKVGLVAPVADVYPSVMYRTVPELMASFVDLGDPRVRLRRMRTRLNAIEALAQIHEHAETRVGAHIAAENERRTQAEIDSEAAPS